MTGPRGNQGKRTFKPIPEEGSWHCFVGNLPSDITFGDFDTLFSGLTIKGIQMMREVDALNCFAYVEFGSRDELVKALEVDGVELRSRTLCARIADYRSKQSQQRNSSPQNLRRAGRGGNNRQGQNRNHNDGQRNVEYHRPDESRRTSESQNTELMSGASGDESFQVVPKSVEEGISIQNESKNPDSPWQCVIKNLPDSMLESDLLCFFNGLAIDEIHCDLDKNYEPSGTAYVVFKSKFDLLKALGRDGQEWEDKKLVVKVVNDENLIIDKENSLLFTADNQTNKDVVKIPMLKKNLKVDMAKLSNTPQDFLNAAIHHSKNGNLSAVRENLWECAKNQLKLYYEKNSLRFNLDDLDNIEEKLDDISPILGAEFFYLERVKNETLTSAVRAEQEIADAMRFCNYLSIIDDFVDT